MSVRVYMYRNQSMKFCTETSILCTSTAPMSSIDSHILHESH